MEPYVACRLIILFCLLFLSSFFSSAETALTSVNKLRIRSLSEEGNRHALIVAKLIDDPKKMLSAVLIGNNVVNLSASALTTSLAIELWADIFAGIATGVLTFLILIFGEITPKTLATLYAERLSLAYAPAIRLLTIVMTPFVYILNIISRFFLRLFGINFDKHPSNDISEDVLLTMVEVSHEEGVIENDERQMINNVVDFGDSYAKDIMVPRIDMLFLDVEAPYQELITLFREEQYSRIPVFEGSKDNVVGILFLKDVCFYEGESKAFHIRDYMREPLFTYELKHTSELMAQMRKAKVSIAIVLDEYGATAGLITLEDLLEEIVGEIRDEYDDDETDAVSGSGSTFIAEGSAKLDEINDITGLSLESDDYDSIAGHILHLLGHIPTTGESVSDEFATYTVEQVEKNRVDSVRIELNK